MEGGRRRKREEKRRKGEKELHVRNLRAGIIHILAIFNHQSHKTHSSCTWLTSLIDPCLDGGGPIFFSRCLLPHTAKTRTTVPTRRITNSTMAITMPAIPPPVKPAHGCHVTRHGSHVIVIQTCLVRYINNESMSVM